MAGTVLVTMVAAVLSVTVTTPAHAAGPSFKMVNYLTGKCVEVDHHDYFANGALVIEEPCNGQPEQLWSSQGTGNGWYHLVNQRSFKCMDVHNGDKSDGGRVQQWACSSTSGQNWKTRTVDPFTGGQAVVSQLRDNRDLCLDAWYGRNHTLPEVNTWHCSTPNDAQTYAVVLV
jgi:hypothetical protein